MSAMVAVACPAAGRYAQYRATVRSREGGVAMGRVGVIAALGALLGLLGGVMTPPRPSPTLRGQVVVDVCAG